MTALIVPLSTRARFPELVSNLLSIANVKMLKNSHKEKWILKGYSFKLCLIRFPCLVIIHKWTLHDSNLYISRQFGCLKKIFYCLQWIILLVLRGK